jgi:hypothetical protein
MSSQHAARAVALAALSTTVITGPIGLAAAKSSHKTTKTTATTKLTTARVSGAKLAIGGTVTLSPDTVSLRRRVRVTLTLSRAGKSDRHSLTLSSKRTFSAHWTTKLTGRLRLVAVTTLSGKNLGRQTVRIITVNALKPKPTPAPAEGTPLVGTFKLTAGTAPSGSAPTGSYFEMLQSNGSPLGNLSSPGDDKDYTPLSPGTDGGLKTDGYQPAPNPPFSGGTSGGALANKIIQPVPFYGVNFSAETGSTDAQTGAKDPVPQVKLNGSTLSGEVSAWDAQWNGQSFNQGTPKPDGRTPAPTTPLSGTYNAATKHFTLQWKSLIVGGPFNGFTGLWHLEGTFVPDVASSSAPATLPVL